MATASISLSPSSTSAPGARLPCDPSEDCEAPASGTLYLFTFLSTLLLLAFIAAAIISRSVYLRRRERRLIALGLWPPPALRPKPDVVTLKEKPRIFEARLTHAVPAHELVHWDAILPLAAAYSAPPAPLAPPKTEPNGRAPNAPLPPSRLGMFPRWQFGAPSPAPIGPAPASASPRSASPAPPAPVSGHVAYFIAMPAEDTRPRPCADEDDERALPLLEFGIAVVAVARTEDGEKRNSAESNESGDMSVAT